MNSFWDFVNKIEPGTWSEWVSGIATALALLFALFQLWLERRKARQLEQRAQASQITAWYNGESSGPGEDEDVYILNFSQSLVFDVMVSLHRAQSETDGSKAVQPYSSVVLHV